jgi:hypothetical protein
MSKVFLIDLAMQWSMLKKHCDRNIGPLNHAFTRNTFVVLIDKLEPNGILVNGYDLGFYMEWVLMGRFCGVGLYGLPNPKP